MKQFRKGDVAVVTGPVVFTGVVLPPQVLNIKTGDVVEVVGEPDGDGDVYVEARATGLGGYVTTESLTPFDEISEDRSIDWGELEVVEYEPSDGLLKTVRTAPWLIYKESPDLLDPNLVRDYVYEGDDE